MKSIYTLQLLFTAFAMTAWGLNIYKLAKCDFEAPYKPEVLYGVGIFTPTCLVTAWMDFE